MSLKAQTFAHIITNPMNTHRFEIYVPELSYTAVVQSTTYPQQENFRDVKLYHQGEEIDYPTIPGNGGDWTIEIPENDDGRIKKEFDAKLASFYNQKTGDFYPHKWDTVIVTARNLRNEVVYAVALKGCWIKGVNKPNLNAQSVDAWKWQYVFHYNWIEDLSTSNANPSVDPLA